MFMRLIAVVVGSLLVGGSASATLVGTNIGTELRADTIAAEVLTPFSSPALIVEPGVEFSGVLQFGAVCPGACKGGIEIDFDDTGFTVSGNSVDGFESMSGPVNLFEILIFNLPTNFLGITEFSGVGWEAELNIESSIRGTQLSLTYGGWNDGMTDRYDFQLAPVPVLVPESTALVLLGLGLNGIGFGRRRKVH